MFVPNRELGSFLLDSRLLSRAEIASLLARAEEEQTTLYELLTRQANLPEDELRRAAAYVLGVPFTPLGHLDVSHDALMLVPEPLSRTRSLAAFAQSEGRVDVLMLDLDDLAHLTFLEHERHLRVIPHLTDRASIKRALLTYQKVLRDTYGEKLKASQGEAVLDTLLSHALLSRAHEVHLEPVAYADTPQLRVRYRIGDGLHDAMLLPKQTADLSSRIKQLSNLSFTLQLPQEGSFKVTLANGEQLRVRAATLPAHAGEKITLHLAREHAGQKGFTLESLGFHGETLERMHECLTKRSGLVLVAAPQGGGKTTTLYTILDRIASPALSIVSIEKKIEFAVAHATQVPVRRDLGQTYASTLRAALKTHPDIVVIEDVQDEDTASLAASAAARGILVIAGVEASSASDGMQKALSLEVDPLLLSSVLCMSAGLRVVRQLCAHCKETYKISRTEIAPLEEFANFGRVLAALKAEGVVAEDTQWKDVLFSRAVGCDKCKGGYAGLLGLQEVLPVSAITRELIVSKKTTKRGHEEEKPLNIIEDGLFKVVQGKTSVEEVLNLIK